MIGLREIFRRWCDAAAPIEAPDHAPCAWADTAPPDRLALDREARRRELEHALAIEAAVDMIECHCPHSHTEADHRVWYVCTPDERDDLTDELEYLTLCGLLDIVHGDVMLVHPPHRPDRRRSALLDIVHGDVMLVRIRKELLP